MLFCNCPECFVFINRDAGIIFLIGYCCFRVLLFIVDTKYYTMISTRLSPKINLCFISVSSLLLFHLMNICSMIELYRTSVLLSILFSNKCSIFLGRGVNRFIIKKAQYKLRFSGIHYLNSDKVGISERIPVYSFPSVSGSASMLFSGG